MKKNTSNINNYDYSESQALEELLEAVNTANIENADAEVICMEETINITIGNHSVELMLGGPQMDAIVGLIKSISAENGYTVDLESNTVTE